MTLAICEEPQIANVEYVEIEGSFGGSPFHIQIHATGDFPAQQIGELNLRLDGKSVPIPPAAYVSAWNPNPAAVEFRYVAGTNADLLPKDVRRPLMSLTVLSHDGNWSLIVTFENRVPVTALVRTRPDETECLAFDMRFQPMCTKLETQKREQSEEDGSQR